MNLRGKKILLGVCGSIAAYKSALLVRLLVKEGADVRVIMTPSASEFIGPLTLATLSGGPVLQKFVKNEHGEWTNHVELGLWADLYLIAPLSAHTLGKLAGGIADNLMVATYLSARCPVMLAPAMDLDMYAHPSTQRNLKLLQEAGNIILEAESGELASGLYGQGRMAEPEHILVEVQELLQRKQDLAGKHILVTAGPTYEAIDPVRFIGNHSSGKMGFALAEACAQRGAQVSLIVGPTSLPAPKHPRIALHRIQSAQEMYDLSLREFPTCDIGIMAAAVADYRPAEVAEQKMKKENTALSIKLEPTPDIALALGQGKKPGQLLIGFALETDDPIAHAQGKLQRKNFDFIVLNSLADEGAGFGVDTNKVSLIDRQEITSLPLMSKTKVAEAIVDKLITLV